MGTRTPSLGLYRPVTDERDWGSTVNSDNWDALDSAIFPVVNVLAAGAKGTGIVDDTSAINAVLAAGLRVAIPKTSAFYAITDALLASVEGTSVESNGAEIRQATPGKGGLHVTASNVKVSGLKMTGPQYAALDATYGERGIYAYGPSYASPITGLEISDCYVSSWGGMGISLLYTKDSKVRRNQVEHIVYAGIANEAIQDALFSGNTIRHIGEIYAYNSASNAYGLYVSNKSGEISKKVKIIFNTVEDVRSWEGIDCHGGEDFIIAENILRDCNCGIAATDDPINSLGHKGVSISKNIISTNHGTGEIIPSGRPGILYNGWGTSATSSDGSITENSIRGQNIGIAAYNTTNLVIANNPLSENGVGIELSGGNYNFQASSNNIRNVTTPGLGFRIFTATADASYGLIGLNVIGSGSAAGVYAVVTEGGTVLFDFLYNKFTGSGGTYTASAGGLGSYTGHIVEFE